MTKRNAGAYWYHGSRYGSLDLDSGGSGNFGGGLFLAREKIYARDYASGSSYENVFAVKLRKGSRVFRPSSLAARRKLAKWLRRSYAEYERYELSELAEFLNVDDLQSNSIYDESEVQEGLDALGYKVVVTNEEALVIDPSVAVVGVRRLDKDGRITSKVNPLSCTWNHQ